jgi:hypothetical protein
MTIAERLLLGVNLQHEAYRDTIVDADNYLETRDAVLSHTEMALRVAGDGLYTGLMLGLIGGNENLQSDLGAYFTAKDRNDMSIFNAYVDNSYDSSADFWRLLGNGDLLNDGYAEVRDINGNVLVSLEELGMNSNQLGAVDVSLAKMFGISIEDANKLIDANNGFFHLGNNNADYRINALGMDDYISALEYNLMPHSLQVSGIWAAEIFSWMNKNEQMDYLKQQVIIQSAIGMNSAGEIAGILRDYLHATISSPMEIGEIDDLFSVDSEFMNENLRVFLNLKEDGSMYTKADELLFNQPHSGWHINVYDDYHRAEGYSDITKWENNDGREVIFGKNLQSGEREIITMLPYGGTYNYVPGDTANFLSHYRFDMNPFMHQYIDEYNEVKKPYDYLLDPILSGKWLKDQAQYNYKWKNIR